MLPHAQSDFRKSNQTCSTSIAPHFSRRSQILRTPGCWAGPAPSNAGIGAAAPKRGRCSARRSRFHSPPPKSPQYRTWHIGNGESSRGIQLLAPAQNRLSESVAPEIRQAGIHAQACPGSDQQGVGRFDGLPGEAPSVRLKFFEDFRNRRHPTLGRSTSAIPVAPEVFRLSIGTPMAEGTHQGDKRAGRGAAGEYRRRPVAKGPLVFTGYYRSEADNREIFTHDGYYKMGDLGRSTNSVTFT